MEIGILTQAAEIAASLALGVCLGFLYEIFRLPRRLFRKLGFLFDLLFCLLLAFGLFLLGMACGSTLRFYMPFAAALGSGIYWALFGRWLHPMMEKLESYGVKALRKQKLLAKKMDKILKNIFSSAKKRFRIDRYIKDGKLGVGMSKSGAHSERRKGDYHEISQMEHTGKVYYPGPSHLRSFHDG